MVVVDPERYDFYPFEQDIASCRHSDYRIQTNRFGVVGFKHATKPHAHDPVGKNELSRPKFFRDIYKMDLRCEKWRDI